MFEMYLRNQRKDKKVQTIKEIIFEM